jgi:prepilin-type N-terminal cleavage/methylation domain-containing protein
MKKRRHGFTLIELLVVIAIIGLLATLSVVAFSSSTAKARDAKRKQNLVQIQKALELYYNDNNAYPSTGGNWWGNCGSFGNHGLTGATGYVPGLAPQYMGILPNEDHPISMAGACANNLANSCYVYNSNGTNYKLVSLCNVETTPPTANEMFYDTVRPTWAFSLCNQGGTMCGL